MHQTGSKLARYSCRGRRQSACTARSVGADVVEDDLTDFLGQLQVPPDSEHRILDAYRQRKPETDQGRAAPTAGRGAAEAAIGSVRHGRHSEDGVRAPPW